MPEPITPFEEVQVNGYCYDGSSKRQWQQLALQQLGRFVREAKHGTDEDRLREVKKQVAKDNLTAFAAKKIRAECDHCGTENTILIGADTCRCRKCRNAFTLELV
jgi:hypothetical protein